MTAFLRISLNIFMILWIFTTNIVKQVHTEDCPRILKRTEWGSKFLLAAELLSTPVSKVFFHHNVEENLNRNCMTKDYCSHRMREIQEYYVQDLYLSDIAYNFVIGGDGNIYEGRGWERVGAHTYGHNEDSISIAFMGDYSEIDPTPEMLTQAENHIECGINKGYISSNYGLYDYQDSTCSLGSGSHFYNTLKSKWPHWHALGKDMPLEKTCLK